MRTIAALSLVLVSCSDYDLQGASEKNPLRPEADSGFEPEVSDTSEPADSGSTGTGEEPADYPSGKVDVVLLIDVAYFYDCYHADLAVNTTALVDALLDSGADVAIGIASYDDYNVDGEWFAAVGGVPYDHGVQLTTERARLHSVASSLSLEWGGDGPGTGYEAVVQAMEGAGYDQDCDGRLDSGADIAPFRKSGTDAFGGNVGGMWDSTVPGTGSEGGMAFRPGSKRVVVLVTENALREKKQGHTIPTGACPGVGAASDAASALKAGDAKLLAVNAYEFWDIDDTPQTQLEDLATNTGSKIDKDGDGAKDDLAVFGQNWDWPSTAVLVDAIWQLAGK